MATAVADPQQNTFTSVKPTEAAPKSFVMGLMRDGREDSNETEQSLQNDKAEAVAQAIEIFKGTIDNFHTPRIQLEDKPVTEEEMQTSDWSLDTAYQIASGALQPLENVVSVVANMAQEVPGGVLDLGKQILGIQPKDKPVTQEEQDQIQLGQWQKYRLDKFEETDARISQVDAERMMKEALYMIGEPISQNSAAELGMNSSFDEENMQTRDKKMAMATKRSENKKVEEQAEDNQNIVETQKPESAVNQHEVREGGLIGGSKSHIGPINAGG